MNDKMLFFIGEVNVIVKLLSMMRQLVLFETTCLRGILP